MIKFFVQRHAAVFTFALLVLIVGTTAYLGLPRESTPEIKQPWIFVTTLYPGVAAKDVENLVTRTIESEIDGLEGITEISSSSRQSISFIFVEFASNVKVETALRRVRERVDIAKASLPSDVEEPSVQELSSSSWPIVITVLSHPDGLKVIDKAAERLQDEFKRVKGVLDVKIAGNLEREVSIELDPASMEHYGLSIYDVMGAVQSANVAIPGGTLKTASKNYSISVNGEIKDARAFDDIVVKSGPVAVPLRELGTVKFGYGDPQTYSRFNGKPAITLSISKRTGENIIDIVDEVKGIVEEERSSLPPDTRVDYMADESRYIRQMVADLENNMFTGFLLVIAVTIFFLGPVNSLFVSLAIPFSMLISFFILQLTGITLNMVVLFSLILALGMLVDNGIVIVENIYRHGSMGKSHELAAIEGSREVAWPIIASTITTVLAFMPIIFMPGIMGDFMSFLPKTVIIVLGSSLFVALTINPVFCARFLRMSDDHKKRFSENRGFFAKVQNWYTGVVRRAVDHAVPVLLGSFLVVISGIILYFFLGREPVFFPEPDPVNAVISLELPQGSPLEKTDSLVSDIEEIVPSVPASLDNFQATSGRAGDGGVFSGIGEEYHKGHIRIAFAPYAERTIPAKQTLDTLKRRLENFTGASVKVEAQESGPPSGHAVSYEVVGQDYAVLGMYADSLLQILERYAEFKLIDTDFEPAKPELQVLVNRDKAAYYGVSVQEVAGTIRNAIHGATIGEFRLGEDEYDIVVRYQDRFRNSVDRLSGLQVVDRNGARIPVDELASIQSASSVGTIQRRNLRRAVSVWADFKDDIQNKNEIKEEIEAQIAKLNLPAGYRVQEGEGEAMRNEATEYLGQAFLVAIFLIVLVLIAQFNSIVQPAIIIASVFLSLGGVFWGYFLSGDDFVIIMSGIGCIALAGVAVNNCIVLVDYTNLLIKWGVPWHEAVIEAGKTRLRPVLLTAITTVLGLMPMAFGVSLDLHPGSFGIQLASESSAFWKAFARAMIYGLSFATAMTLVVVPVMLSLSFRIWPPKAEKQAQ